MLEILIALFIGIVIFAFGGYVGISYGDYDEGFQDGKMIGRQEILNLIKKERNKNGKNNH